MKKTDIKYLLLQIVGCVVIAMAVIGIPSLKDGTSLSGFLSSAIALSLILMFVWFVLLASGVNRKIASKTMEAGSDSNHFTDYSTFTSSNSIIRITDDGRIGFVSTMNPKEFQLLDTGKITNPKSDYMKGPLGGTSLVYFQFQYDGTRVRIPTFTSNSACSLNDSRVLEGISKADKFCEIIQNTITQG